MIVFVILLLAVFQCTITQYLAENPDYYQLGAYTCESPDFRSMRLGKLIAGQNELDFDMLTTLMIQNDYDLRDLSSTDYSSRLLCARRPADYRKLKQAYETVLGDLKYFPVPKSSDPGVPDVCYLDGWMDKRTYKSGGNGGGDSGGKGMAGNGADDAQEKSGKNGGDGGDGGGRGHEGCDIMGEKMPRGFYPVVSMSSGVVEKVGWLELGGWRIGIRSPGGAYLYYAHLYGYSRNWQEGDPVRAGDLLGYMGDTGYSKVEGTTGNFDVHLHVGIYLRTDHHDELSVDPYWILKYLEKNRFTYRY